MNKLKGKQKMLQGKLPYLVIGLSLIVGLTGCGKKQETTSFAVHGQQAKGGSNSTANSSQAPKIATQATPAVKKSVEIASATQVETMSFKPFPVYSDENSPDNHFFPSGWMGDYSDISIDSSHMNSPHSGSTSMRIKYNNNATSGARWAGVYWQNPANNWGNRAGGYDLTGATKLVFWARGENGGERIEEAKVGGITGQFSDSDIAGIGPIQLTSEWKRYVIDLQHKDLSSIIGGFAWAANLDNNPDGMTFYLDDIRYE